MDTIQVVSFVAVNVPVVNMPVVNMPVVSLPMSLVCQRRTSWLPRVIPPIPSNVSPGSV